MLNFLWLILILLSIICSIMTGKVDALVIAVTDSAKAAFDIALSLGGVMAFWLGLMRIAEDAGLVQSLAKLIQPVLGKLFPEVPPDHPAIGAMVLNIAANMLGLGNAATPFGLKAMELFEKLNPNPGEATNAMCMFTAINTSSVQLVPATGIAFLAAGGASHPANIVITTFLATIMSSIVGIFAAWCYQNPGVKFCK